MDKFTICSDHFEELKNMTKGIMECNKDIVESNLKLQGFHEEGMKGLEERFQQESIPNLQKQVIHIVNHID